MYMEQARQDRRASEQQRAEAEEDKEEQIVEQQFVPGRTISVEEQELDMRLRNIPFFQPRREEELPVDN